MSVHNFGALPPLPEGYRVEWFDEVEHFIALGPDDWESVITCDPYQARKWCLDHARRVELGLEIMAGRTDAGSEPLSADGKRRAAGVGSGADRCQDVPEPDAHPHSTIDAASTGHDLRADDLIRDGIPEGMTLREAMAIVERRLVEMSLYRNGGRSTETARELGMSREGLYRLRARLGMPVRQGGPVPVPEDWRERLKR